MYISPTNASRHSPYRQGVDQRKHLELPVISSTKRLASLIPKQLWHYRNGSKLALFVAISRYKSHHWKRPILASVVTRRIRARIGTSRVSLKFQPTKSQYVYIRIHLSTSSSEHSSPQPSCSSFILSSRKSSPIRSPPSSHDSLSPSPHSHHPRRAPRIQVSSLLADPHTRTYQLDVVQHPIRTAAFGTANLSRLPLTPPIIVQLTIRDSSGNSIVPQAELPFLVAHLSLYSSDGISLDMGSSIGRDHTPPILYGNLVSSVDQLEDLQGNLGLFFLFPDVSIRWRGEYQLGISLLRIYRHVPELIGPRNCSDEFSTQSRYSRRPKHATTEHQAS
ncbi:hypothetical protein AX14_009118 [Amanita brunnescens Koide BX004]|nr:hypothetical protein AX14_009118 [Amanita brunnescens Koide BX004]